MKRISFLGLIILFLTLISCVQESVPSTSVNNNNTKKITSLQAVIDDPNIKDGDTIDLSQYAKINDFDYNAVVDKELIIKNGEDLKGGTLTVSQTNVELSKINNANVTASHSLGNGSLKISSSSLATLNIQGGGSHSIYITDKTTVQKTILNKSVDKTAANNDEYVRLVLDKTVNIQSLSVIRSAIIDATAGNKITKNNLPSVIFDISDTTSDESINLAVSPNVTFETNDDLARVLFQDNSNDTDKLEIFVLKGKSTAVIDTDFFISAFDNLIGDVNDEKKNELETILDQIKDQVIIEDTVLSIDNNNENSSSSSDDSSDSTSSSLSVNDSSSSSSSDENSSSSSSTDSSSSNDDSSNCSSSSSEDGSTSSSSSDSSSFNDDSSNCSSSSSEDGSTSSSSSDSSSFNDDSSNSSSSSSGDDSSSSSSSSSGDDSSSSSSSTTTIPSIQTCATPVISGTTPFESSTIVSISCETTGANIYYTTDGSAPTTSSTQYTGSFTVSATTTVKAIAVKSEYNDSEISVKTFTNSTTTTTIVPYTNGVTIYVKANSAPTIWVWQRDGSASYACSELMGYTWDTQPTMTAATGMNDNTGWYMTNIPSANMLNGMPFAFKLNKGGADITTTKTTTFWYDNGIFYDSDPTIIPDPVKPTVIVSPNSGSTVKTTGSIKVTFTDGYDTITNTNVTINGQSFNMGTTAGTWSRSLADLGITEDDIVITVSVSVTNSIGTTTVNASYTSKYVDPCNDLILSVPAGDFWNEITVFVSGDDTYYYTTDGTDPTTNSTAYTSAGIDITTTTTLKVLAHDSTGAKTDAVVTAIYTKQNNQSITENPSGVLLQGFTWNSAPRGTSWNAENPSPHWGKWYQTMISRANDIKNTFAYVWCPPPSKTDTASPEGYAPTELNDLNNCYGTTEELQEMISAISPAKAIADIVINHRAGTNSWGDFTNPSWCEDYYAICSDDEGFTDPNSPMRTSTKRGSCDTGEEYATYRDLDHTNPVVQKGIYSWMNSVLKRAGFIGWRYDYVKGYAPQYVGKYNKETDAVFSVGEYWPSSNYSSLNASSWGNEIKTWIEGTASNDGQKSKAFDFALKGALNNVFGYTSDGSSTSGTYNYGLLADASNLYISQPEDAVTFVDNHDTGSNQGHCTLNPAGLGAAYALILTHPGYPCVSWSHYFTFAESGSRESTYPYSGITASSSYLAGKTIGGSSKGYTLRQHIDYLISLRKSYGITYNSQRVTLEATSSHYASKITGTNGSLIVEIGSGYNPNDSEYVLIYYGDNFAIYSNKKCVSPTISFSDDGICTITCLRSGSTIMYKTGSDSYQIYTAPFSVTDGQIVYAYATADEIEDSDTVSKKFIVGISITVTVDAWTWNDNATVFAWVWQTDQEGQWVNCSGAETTVIFTMPVDYNGFILVRCPSGTAQPSWTATGNSVGRIYNKTQEVSYIGGTNYTVSFYEYNP